MPHNLMRAARFHEYGPPESLVQCPYQACLAHDPPPKRRIDAVLGHRGRTDEVPPAVFLLSSVSHDLRSDLSA